MGVVQGARVITRMPLPKKLRLAPEITMDRMIEIAIHVNVIHPQRYPRRDTVMPATLDHTRGIVHSLTVSCQHVSNHSSVTGALLFWHSRKKRLVIRGVGIETVPKSFPHLATVIRSPRTGIAHQYTYSRTGQHVHIAIHQFTSLSFWKISVIKKIYAIFVLQ